MPRCIAGHPGRPFAGRRRMLGVTAGLCLARPSLAQTSLAQTSLAAAGSADAAQGSGAEPLPAPSQWHSFRDRFIAADGRVVDNGNAGVSHSEGQGYALLFAERFADRAVFERVLGWTRRHLRRPQDALHAWRYRPGAAVPVDDPNNATDGDLLIAWALLRAHARWGVPAWRADGVRIGRAVLGHLVREVGGRSLLLPAVQGFEHADRVVINPSYYVFPALQALAQAVPDPVWPRLIADGILLLRKGRFGRWGLPADWLAVERPGQAPEGGPALAAWPRLRPAEGFPCRFSYDAVRVPLHLAWSGLTAEPAVLAAARFWSAPESGRPLAWAPLDDAAPPEESAAIGVSAVARLVQAATGSAAPALPEVAEARDYYSAALTLLARIAAARALPQPAAALPGPRRA